MEAMEAMETLETSYLDENNLYVVEFSRNSLLLNDIDDEQNDNNIIEETQDDENVSRGRSRGRSRSRGRPRGSRGRGNNNDRNEQPVELPLPPIFNTFQHSKPLHEFTVTLPREHQFPPSAYSIFSLFFSLEQIKIIVKNTNIYAYAKKAGEGRKWKDLTIEEFQIWLAIVIYAGIFKLPSIRDYWNKDSKFPEHKIARYMTLLRFEQVLLI